MSREVRHDGAGAFEIRFPFDRLIVERIKLLPNRRWNAQERFWSVPERDVVALVDLLHRERFRFDGATVQLYRSLGGTAAIDVPPVADPDRVPRERSLFDEPFDGAGEPIAFPRDWNEAAAAPAPPQALATTQDYTVSRLNTEVKVVLEGVFDRPLWLVGEISGFDRGAHKRHVSFQLAEHDASGRIVSCIDATLFGAARRDIEWSLARAGRPFRLEDGVMVRVAVRIELHVPWGSYRVVVQDLDVHYTLGEAARRREEILRRLETEGLLGRNAGLPLPAIPLRVGLVTSAGSDACNDVLRTLQESRFAFRLTIHGARMQGRATEPSVLNALDWFRERAGDFDVVLVCRGGGSRTDLAWLDSESLGRAVALFPLPVIAGIGHEQDRSVLDTIARRSKTPTAAATLVVDTVRAGLVRLEASGRSVLEAAGSRIAEQAGAAARRGRRLVLAAGGRLRFEGERLAQTDARLVRGSRSTVSGERRRLAAWLARIPASAGVGLVARRTVLAALGRGIARAARRDVAEQRRGLIVRARSLGMRAAAGVGRELERTEGRGRRLHVVDPRRVVERGYAILRRDGHVVRGPDQAPRGSALAAELAGGTLLVRSEGPARADTGEST